MVRVENIHRRSTRSVGLHAAKLFAIADERELVDLRRQGASWNEVALRAGSSPEAVRKRVHRATARILRELELDEGATHV